MEVTMPSCSNSEFISSKYTPKQRMLNAYKGIFSDRYPVAPEFWCYYPAKVLGVDMMELQREIPLWKALQAAFKKYDCEGWGCVSPEIKNPDVSSTSKLEKISEKEYRETTITKFMGREFYSVRVYDKTEP